MTARALLQDTRGTAVVELALVLPILLMVLFGTVTYGTYVAMAHAVQQAANEGARAGLPGLTPDERATLASAAAERALVSGWKVPAASVSVSTADDGAALRVAVRYDASGNALLSLPLIPRPDPVIVKSAAVRLVGL